MLEGTTIYLLPIRQQDTEDIIRWRNQPFVRDKFIYRELFTRESHEKWLETMVKTKKVEQFIIYVKEENKAVGSVYLRDIDRENGKAEYGIFIGEEAYLGRGIGSETAKVVLTYAFSELHLHKIMLRVFATNVRAIESYKKAGFVEEGYFKEEVKIENKYYDIIFMAAFKGNSQK